MVLGGAKGGVLEFRPINDEGAATEEKDTIYAELKEEFDRMPIEDTILILEDFNAQIEKEEHLQQPAGNTPRENKR